jgi:hydroxypyruvate isomerase
MPKFAANISLLFTELPFLDRIAAASDAGFDAVELQFPYAVDEQRLADALTASGLPLVLHNLPAGSWERGDRGIACHPRRVDEFRRGVDTAIRYAKALNCPRLNCLAGVRPPDVGFETARDTLIDNLRHASEKLEREGLDLLIEPINSRDVPGFFIDRSRMALDLMVDAGCSNLKLQYDIYHAQVMEGDLARTVETALDRIGHIQIADTPGRHEPGTGEINFSFLLERLDAMGYEGWVGCEYVPWGSTLDGLGWMAPYRTGGPA